MARPFRNSPGTALAVPLIVPWFQAIALAFGIPGTTHAHDSGFTTAQLATADTAISVEAGDAAPRLTTLTLRDAISWENRASELPPDHIETEGRSVPLTWRLDRTSSRVTSDRIELVYNSSSPRLNFIWSWRARARYGPLEHTVSIGNSSGRPVWLPLQASLRFDWATDPHSPLQRFWVEKGADTPSANGTHLDPLREGDRWEGKSSTYARPVRGRPREMIPYVLVQEPAGEQRGWFVAVEFSGRTRIVLQREGGSLRGDAGLDPDPGPYHTQLPAGETFTTPPILLGTFADGPDGAGNLLHRWVREVLNNPRTIGDPTYPDTVSNSWGSGMAIDEPLAHRMIESSRQLGIEMFHLDAGWFRDVGDWQPDPRKFPHGIAALADFAHERGLKFGLWIDWTQAATSTRPGALNVNDPVVRQWLIAPPPAGWQHTEPFKGITIDLGIPAAAAWAQKELERLVSDYHLDMLEHDGYLVAQGRVHDQTPPTPPPLTPQDARQERERHAARPAIYEDSGYLWVASPDATDDSYRATLAYYRIYEELRRHHPQLLLEICNDGGRMVDLGSAAHGDYFSITDTYDPVSNRRAFYDASYVLPPAMLESYVADWPAPRIDNFRYMLRSGMLGWFSLMLDTSRWDSQRRAEARTQLQLYKSELRPLIREADLYHVSDRPDGKHWDGIEYFSPRRGRGVLYAFRGSMALDSSHRFLLRGLTSGDRYLLRFEDAGASANKVLTGDALMRQGLTLELPQPLTSELVFLQRIPTKPGRGAPAASAKSR